MMAIAFAMVAGAQLPAPPPSASGPMDFAVNCRIFSDDGQKGVIRGNFAHDYGAMSSVTFSSSGLDLPLPESGSKWALINGRDFWLKAEREGVNYSWRYQLPVKTGARQGLVTVRAADEKDRTSNTPMDYIATGICDVTATKASIQ